MPPVLLGFLVVIISTGVAAAIVAGVIKSGVLDRGSEDQAVRRASVDTAQTPTKTPVPRPTKTPTPQDLASLRQYRGPITQESGGVTITIDAISLVDYKEFYDSLDASGRQALDLVTSDSEGAITFGQIYITVQNNSDQTMNVFPDQGTVVTGSEQVGVSLISSDHLGGEYFPGVMKEGKILFFLKRTTAAEITSLLYVVNAPFGDSFLSQGDDFKFSLDLGQ